MSRLESGGAVRVWVPGCGRGDDVYAITLSLLVRLTVPLAADALKVFGTDTSSDAIHRAREGRFASSLRAVIPPATLERLFVETHSGYEAAKVVRDACVFARHDLVRDIRFTRMDLVWCRDLESHVPPDQLPAVLAKLESALQEGGILARVGRDEQLVLRKRTSKVRAAAPGAPESRDEDELESVNEELRAINDELARRNQDEASLKDDLANILSSSGLPMLLVGADGRLRRYTRAAAEVLELKPRDVGRDIEPIEQRLRGVELRPMIDRVSWKQKPLTRAVQDRRGHWYELTVRPFRKAGGATDGAVITLGDVDRLKRDAEQLAEARDFARNVIDAVQDVLLVASGGRIVSVNRAFEETFAGVVHAPEGRWLEDIAVEVPEMAVLAEAGSGQPRDERTSARMEIALPRHGRRIFTVTARRIRDGGPQQILLALHDVTDAERAAEAIRASERAQRQIEYQSRLQRMAFDASLAQERERRKIAADLHDEVAQSLALAQVRMSALRESLDSAPRAELSAVSEIIAGSVSRMRTLIFDLSPPVLYDLGLPAALEWLAEQVEARYGLKIELDNDTLEKPLTPEAAGVLFRSIRELLANVAKHAHTSSARVRLRCTGESLELEVADGGVGFDPSEATAHSAGFGLFSVKEQISRLGGTFEVESAPGSGTRSRITVPLVPHEDPAGRRSHAPA